MSENDNELKDKFLSESLGVSPEFFERLQSDDDWAFIIKLHALLEAALNHLLTKHFGDDRLLGVISNLDNTDGKRGKMAFVSALNLIPKEYRLFIRQLSEIRNAIVHDVKNLGFDLKNHVENFASDQKKNWKNSILPRFKGPFTGIVKKTGQKVFITPEDFLEMFPRQAVQATMANIISIIINADLVRSGGVAKTHNFNLGTFPVPDQYIPRVLE